MLSQKAGIYKICCLVNNKSYIGSSANMQSRKADHFRLLRQSRHPNRYLQAAWKKYGEDAFVFIILKFCSKKYLLHYEQIYIDKFQAYGQGFNLRPKASSNAGWKTTAEQRERYSQALKGRVLSKETRERMSLAKQGIIFSQEHRKHLSEARKGYIPSPESCQKISEKLKGRISNRKDVHLSLETRRKMSESHQNKKLSENTKKKLRLRKISAETKRKMSESQFKRWKHTSQEIKDAMVMKRVASQTHDYRSEYVKRGWQTRRSKLCVV
jgi:group I intron endonuclease